MRSPSPSDFSASGVSLLGEISLFRRKMLIIKRFHTFYDHTHADRSNCTALTRPEDPLRARSGVDPHFSMILAAW